MAGLRDGDPSGPGLAPGEAEAGACAGAAGDAAHPALIDALGSEADQGPAFGVPPDARAAPGGSGAMSIPGSPGARGDARGVAGQPDGDPGHVLACPSRAPC